MTTPLISRPPVEATRFRTLGTVASVLVTDPAAGDTAAGLLHAELAALDRACSRFRGDSELSRLNRADGREVRISQLLTDALAAALGAAQATGGDVDPTCGQSLVSLGYDRDFTSLPQPGTPPPAGAADLGGVPAAGWQHVELDRARRTARVPAGVLLDLGATAKAFAADRAAVRIAAAAGCGVLVNLGGDIRVAGPSPDDGWSVGIADDLGPGDAPDGTQPAQAVVITDGGLATSSTKVRSWRRSRATVHHIVVPATGLPAQSRWRTATVAAASCLHANAASTAAIIRGDQAAGWLGQLGLPARLVGHDGTVLTVAGWPAGQPREAGA
ncbi:MAG TPA: FAD:protein FMN transferase [Streptosporangiaceae bacterium]|jgi:thiamine biosynthesis lipoprotein